jgi:hypothetical protein
MGRALRRQRVAQPPALPDHYVEDPGPPESVKFDEGPARYHAAYHRVVSEDEHGDTRGGGLHR